jgi:putative ATP-dependent endonuclease of OLD family
MKITCVETRNYRSLRNAELRECGQFNVLIGKNNSGKSTALLSIAAFFKILQTGEIVNLDPPVGLAQDYCDKDAPITIRCEFHLTQDELKRILTQISEERPQIQVAVSTVSEACGLSIETTIARRPGRHAYVSNIELTDASSGAAKKWTLLRVGPQAEQGLYVGAQALRSATSNQDAVNRMLRETDRGDWDRMREGGASRRLYFSQYGPIGQLLRDNSPVREAIESLPPTASYDEFVACLRAVYDQQEDIKTAARNRPLEHPITTFAGEEVTVPNYVKSLVQDVGRIRLLHLTEIRRPIGSVEAAKLLQLKTRRGGGETLSAIQNTVADLLGVRVDAFDSTADGSGRESRAELDVDDFLVEMNGSGIRESLRLVLDVAFEKPSILLVEEPEIHLHPALETSMMRFLQTTSRQCQVFITTHSTNFLDVGEFTNVFLLWKNGYTQIDRLDRKGIEERVPQELGLRLSSLFMYDRLVFVEGPSDELVIRELSNVVNVNLGKENVGFIPLHGIGNLTHYAAKEILDFLSKRRVRLWFLIDRDERATAEIERIKTRLGASVVFFPTRPRELENYLLVPRAVSTYLAERVTPGPGPNPPTEVEIKRKFNEIAETLKLYTTWKHAANLHRPLYPMKRRAPSDLAGDVRATIEGDLKDALGSIEASLQTLESSTAGAIADIERRWDQEKLSLVPGAILLDELFKLYGLRFDKMRDSARLASYLTRPELDGELRSLIEGIGGP